MARPIPIAIILAMAGLVAISARGAAPEKPAPAAPVAPNDPFTRELLNRLDSADLARRDAARNELADIAGMMQQPEILQKLQESTIDQGLKALFQQRLNEIKAKEDEERFANPPPISLSVKNVTLPFVVASLNGALKGPVVFESYSINNTIPSKQTFTLEVKDKPLWEVLNALQDQQPIELDANGASAMRLTVMGTRALRRYAIAGPAMAFVTSITYQRALSLKASTSSAPPTLSVGVAIAIDPRMQALGCTAPDAVNAVDDEGRILAHVKAAEVITPLKPTNFYSQSLALAAPDRPGKSLALAFNTTIITTVGDTLVALDDLIQSVDKPFVVGNQTLRIDLGKQILGPVLPNPQPATIILNISATPIAGMPAPAPNNVVSYSVFDASGHKLLSSSLRMESMANKHTTTFSTGNALAPYKVEFHVPGRRFDIPVHFELKDLPMP